MTFAVRDLEARPGEIAFTTAPPGREPARVRFRSTLPVTGTADVALAASLLPAMATARALELPGGASPRLLRTQREWQAIQLAWAPSWPFPERDLNEVEVRAQARAPRAAAAGRGVAMFFSGGVDSWSTLLDTPDVTDLIFARGLDLRADEAELADLVEGRLSSVGAELGLPLHTVETNLRTFADAHARWEAYYVCALAAIALMHQERFARVVIAGWTDYATLDAMSANPMSDHLWSTEELELVHAGGRRSRMDRVVQIAGDPRVQRSLRVCWENPGGAYNCGRCRKCLMTMLALELTGHRPAFETFPAELPLERVDAITLEQPSTLTLWTDIHDAAVAAGRDDIAGRIAPRLAAGRERLGLPEGFHPRRSWTEAVAAERERADRLQHGLDVVRGSRSWRLTRPLRRERRRP